MDARSMLMTILDAVDYTSGACSPTEMVGAVLDKRLIVLAKKVIADTVPKSGHEKCPHGFDDWDMCPDCCH